MASGQAGARGSTCSKEKATAELLDTVGRCEDDGGYGYSREYPVEKLMRDVKVFQIFEGTNQIQRMTIANVLDKEYK